MSGEPGKFADQVDVVSRFEGDEFPNDRLEWVNTRIIDVENELMGRVPSLRKSAAEIEADSVARGDPTRPARVTALVAHKVLDMFRNPDPRLSQVSQTMEQDTVTRSFSRNPTTGAAVISFTEDELNSVRLRPKRRSKIGSIPIAPWGVGCS